MDAAAAPDFDSGHVSQSSYDSSYPVKWNKSQLIQT